MKISAWMGMALFAFASAAHAAGECDKYSDAYDRTYCFARLFVESDKELNEVYRELGKRLKASVRQDLKWTQREWIKYREETCRTSGDESSIDVDCTHEVNRARIQYLRDRLRECKAGECRPAAVVRQSW